MPVADPHGAERALLPVEIGGVWLVVPAAAVREILGEVPWLPLPGASANVPGVLPWRGRAVALVDLGALVRADQLVRGRQRRRVVIATHAEHTLAFPVDRVREVQGVSADAIRPAHVTRQRLASGEVELDGTVAALLDLDALVAELAAESGIR